MKFSGYCFYVNTNQWGDFQVCISVLLMLHLFIICILIDLVFYEWHTQYFCLLVSAKQFNNKLRLRSSQKLVKSFYVSQNKIIYIQSMLFFNVA